MAPAWRPSTAAAAATTWGLERWLSSRRTTSARGPPLREVGQEAGVGAVPPVDGLVGVAHDEEVLVVPEQGQQQPALQRVDVL